MRTMIGRRRFPDELGHLHLGEGDYGKRADGGWVARPPGCDMGDLKNHTVTEHADGTISVTPSIALTGETSWHGYLEKGVWKKV